MFFDVASRARGGLTSPWLAAFVFLVLSLHFLYFFVDEEMIRFVSAQNLLRGRGLDAGTGCTTLS
jgi:hypothetical protein